MICAACLKRLARPTRVRRHRLAGLVVVVEALAGLLTAWLFFYAVGRDLLAIPDSFHEGTVWKSHWMDEP